MKKTIQHTFFLLSMLVIPLSCRGPLCKNYEALLPDQEYKIKVKFIRKDRGFVCINTRYVFDPLHNHEKEYNQKWFDNYIKEGDSILIRPLNDTVYVKRNGTVKWFRHGG
ncbi:MAG TPA: hypothetical protein PKW08_02460 [Flavobacteriaceae bacterium]|nr:hypothetical protein [Flavobacteriaceae bacterium]MCB9212256.1 hypothetical protein [Alteromonas sp.]HPF10365.1 hypothetical protein [Flavobacteriaceae bacterium]HQU20429.1 hypothetical protein [Flavobacteriaceae bacterium]HQU65767.1 hypothetical protein [Flavobacteriaceae bacterium]